MKSLFVHRLPGTTTLAVTQDGSLKHIHLLKDDDPLQEGSVYRAQVSKVLPGIEAAFVRLNANQTAMLNRSDLPKSRFAGKKTTVDSVLKQGQNIVVQIKSPPLEGKVPRVSAKIKLIGFFLIAIYGEKGIRFSRRFEGNRDSIKTSLKNCAQSIPIGWVVRSSAANATPEQVCNEAQSMIDELGSYHEATEKGPVGLLSQANALLNTIKEHSSEGFRSIYVDDESFCEMLKKTLLNRIPSLAAKVMLHGETHSLFEVFGIAADFQKALANKVWLKSGGYLSVHTTSALTVLDVNSGKDAKKRGGRDPALRTNLEAVEEIANQLILRNISGLILVDFITLAQQHDRQKVNQRLAEWLQKDAVRTTFLPITDAGLVQITRERKGLDLTRVMNEPCRQCAGSGWHPNLMNLTQKIQERLLSECRGIEDQTPKLLSGPVLGSFLNRNRKALIEPLEQRLGTSILLEIRPEMDARAFEIRL